jgi:membrane protease YdiL (CAAX protease family)
MRRVTKQDVFAILKTLSVLFAGVIVFGLLQEHLSPAAPAGMDGDAEELPLIYGLVDAVIAGLTEEFAYRGYLIEELGELSRNRFLAAVVSVVAFGLAHVGSGYGWSIELFYPVLCGIAFTALYLWRRNLWACVLMHIGLDALYAVLHAI